MLVLSFNPGESLLAVGEFELFFLGINYSDLPEFQLRVARDRAFVVSEPEGAITVRHASRFAVEEFTVRFGGFLRVGDTIVKVQPKSRERVRMAIEAPQDVRLKRPAKHGGSLVAR